MHFYVNYSIINLSQIYIGGHFMPSKDYRNFQELKAILAKLFSEDSLAVLSRSECFELRSYLSDLRYPVEVQIHKTDNEEFASIFAIFSKEDP